MKLRPNGTSHAALARALFEAGRTEEAKAAIDRALATPLRSARTFWTASKIAEKLGDRAAASRQLASARALNPRVDDDAP